MQPYYVQSFFLQAFPRLKGEVRTRENNRRWEIVRVPAALIELDRLKPSSDPLLRKYERICFEREHLRVPGKLQEAKLIHPGHPLVARTIDSILEQDGPLLEQGAVMVDPTDCGEDPWLLFLLEHAIEEGRPDIARRTIASRRVQFVKVFADGRSAFAGWAPHLDLRPMGEGERRLVQDVLHAPWIVQGAQDLARNHAMEKIVPEHRDEVVQARAADVAKTLEAVHERLSAEITYWSARSAELRQEIAAGKDARLTVDNIERRVDELSARLDSRTRELIASKELRVKAPEMLGVALVIPQGLLDLRSGEATPASPVDAEARRRVEILAMDAVSRDFRERGFEVRDVSADKCGWDLTMIEPATEAHPSAVWHVEVKGREAHQDTVTVTHNEIVTALNQKDKFLLAIVPVDQGRVVATHYIPKPFEREPEFDDASINKSLPKLLERAVALDQILSADFAETSRALPKESP
ncbi:MAG: DUF3883 domain-containing protein [Fibrobacteres bacterium]|nr:DUF3883 domain-containing protein [Fibrobacterota bacterium]